MGFLLLPAKQRVREDITEEINLFPTTYVTYVNFREEETSQFKVKDDVDTKT